MVHIIFYFQVHQPYRLKPYRVLDIAKDASFFDDDLNASILRKVSEKCYLPANRLMLDLINKYDGEFKVSYSVTGTLIEQLEAGMPEVLSSFQNLARTGAVEFLGETYYHSLAAVFDADEFIFQIKKHSEAMIEKFGFRPITFRNTELIYSDKICEMLSEAPQFKVILTEGADSLLKWRSPLFPYKTHLKTHYLLLKYYHLSDDIAFRFSDRNWKEYPLKSEKFTGWLRDLNATDTGGKPLFVNLFMDYETFGEHQWASSGIFDFFESLIGNIIKSDNLSFAWPSDVNSIIDYEPESLSVPEPISWADTERDLSAWLSNSMQFNAIKTYYEILKTLKETSDSGLLEKARRLSTSDLYYYMCSKYFQDGDVHKYFSPYASPENAYIYFMNCLANLERNSQSYKSEKQ